MLSKNRVVSIIVISLIFAGCSGDTTLPIPSLTNDPTVTASLSPTPTLTPTVTVTPTPTSTPSPTATPTPITINVQNVSELEEIGSFESDSLYQLIASPDGGKIAARGAFGIRLYTSDSFELISSMEESYGTIAWSPNSLQLIQRGGNGFIIWNVENWQKADEIEFEGTTSSIAWSPNAPLLAVAEQSQKNIVIIDINTGEELNRFISDNKSISGLVWSTDGKKVAASDTGGNVVVWDIERGVRSLTITGHRYWAGGVDWSHAGDRLVTVDAACTVYIRNAANGSVVKILAPGTSSPIFGSIQWSPDDSMVALVDISYKAVVWDATSGERLYKVEDVAAGSFVWSSDSERLIIGGLNGSLVSLDIEAGTLTEINKGGLASVRQVNWSPDGRLLALGDTAGTALILESNNLKPLQWIYGASDTIQNLAWSPDSQRIAVGGEDPNIRIWNVESGELTHDIDFEPGQLRLAWSPSEEVLVSGNIHGKLSVWNTDTGELIRELASFPSAVFDMAWSPDGKRLVIAGASDFIHVWGTEEWKPPMYVYIGENADSIAWSSGGDLLAAVVGDASIHIFDTDTVDLLATITPGGGLIYRVLWSPTEELLAVSISDGGIVRTEFWQISGGDATIVATLEAGYLHSWSPDGTLLAFTSGGSLKVYGIPPNAKP